MKVQGNIYSIILDKYIANTFIGSVICKFIYLFIYFY